jgi:hypothetical protein
MSWPQNGVESWETSVMKFLVLKRTCNSWLGGANGVVGEVYCCASVNKIK